MKQDRELHKSTVFILVNTFGRGGAEMSLAVLAAGLIKKGYGVHYISLWFEDDCYDFGFLEALGVNLKTLGTSKQSLFFWVKQLLSLIRMHRPQFIYSAMYKADIAAQICSRLTKVAHAASIRTNPIKFYHDKLKLLLFSIFNCFQRNLVFISKRALVEYQASMFGWFLKYKNLYVLHNPIEHDPRVTDEVLLSKFQDIKSKLNGSKDAVVKLAIVSRLVPGKGIVETVRLLQDILRTKKFSLSIYGDGPLREILIHTISQNRSDNVFFKGFIKDKYEIFINSDILIFPSSNEGFGRVPFEAFLMGNFIVCNEEASIINEFNINKTTWHDYKEPLDITNSLIFFKKFEPEDALKSVSIIKNSLDPDQHVRYFEEIMDSCQKHKSCV